MTATAAELTEARLRRASAQFFSDMGVAVPRPELDAILSQLVQAWRIQRLKARLAAVRAKPRPVLVLVDR